MKHTFPCYFCLCLMGCLQLSVRYYQVHFRCEEWGSNGWCSVPKLMTHSDCPHLSDTGLPSAWLWVGVEGPVKMGQEASGSSLSNTGGGIFHKSSLCDLAAEMLLVWWKPFDIDPKLSYWWTECPHLWLPAICSGSFPLVLKSHTSSQDLLKLSFLYLGAEEFCERQSKRKRVNLLA